MSAVDIVYIVFLAVVAIGLATTATIHLANILERHLSGEELPMWGAAWVNQALTHRWVRIVALVAAPVIYVAVGVYLIVGLFWILISELPDVISEVAGNIRSILRR